MPDYIFFGGLVLYFAAMCIYAAGQVFKKENLLNIGWIIFLCGAAVSFAYLVMRGIKAGRLPLSNQFEFAASFSWGIAVMMIIIHYRTRAEWIELIGMIMTFLILSYAALQPREVTELMPALRSAWFGFHIGTAAISYASFMLAGGAGIRYLITEKKNPESEELETIDYFMYRLIAFGLILLTLTIVSGAIWAEEAWSSFWTWDPKEVWALITWIQYSIFIHLHLNRHKRGRFMAWYAVIGIPVVLFTFIGVNTLLSGLHSYAAVMTRLFM